MPPAEGLPQTAASWRVTITRFWALAGGFWTEAEGRREALGILAGLLALNAAEVALFLRFNTWQRDLFDALERRDSHTFLLQCGVLVLIIGGFCVVAGLAMLARRRLALGWRAWLARRLTAGWLGAGHTPVPNVDGRIAEDARISTEEAVELAASLANTLITLACFVGVLWTLSAHPPILLGGTSVAVPGYLLWIAIAYSLAGMTISMLAGRPLVRATDRRLAMEADYRAALVRTRDEGRVEPGQNPVLGGLFRHLAGAFGRQSGAFALLETCVCFITRFGLGLPYLVATPAYLAGVVSLGWVMQAAQAFQMVSTALAWPIQNMPRIAVWRASAERVILLADSLAPAPMPAPAGRPVPGALAPAARPPQMVG